MPKLLAFIHPVGWPFIGIFALLALLLGLRGPASFLIGVILLVWCVYFFRNPERVTPVREGLVVSPADGVIVDISEVTPEADLGLEPKPYTKISVFLNVFDVHVNRIPVAGKIVHTNYRPGKFVNASLDKASVDNERMSLAVEMTGNHPYAGQKMGVVQIAGLIARRIVSTPKVGDVLKTGERYGIIRFGSRADIYLPQGFKPLVIKGQRMIGGETVLADALSSEDQRQGEVR